MKPYAESCDQNRDPILAIIEPQLRTCGAVLEIGSGTGQHAVYFARRMPHLVWIPSDLEVNHPGIELWRRESGLNNVRPPLRLDVAQSQWPQLQVDAVFSANTLHIMHWPQVQAMLRGVGQLLPPGGLLLVYGPFNYRGEYTSDSNARFDRWLKARDPASGIRDFEAVDKLSGQAGMMLSGDFEMPANNRMLCWRRPGLPRPGGVTAADSLN